MQGRVLTALMIFTALAASDACVEDNPSYCTSDDDCSGLCHPLGHFCYDGCSSDDDCSDDSLPGYSASTPHCNPSSRHCEPDPTPPPLDSGVDERIVVDAGANIGSTCERDDECASRHCVGRICCEDACEGACHTCSTGECRPRPAGEPCGPQSCADGELTVNECNNEADCITEHVACGGFVCTIGGDDCLESCDKPDDCLEGYKCEGDHCQAELPKGVDCGENDFACASRHCVDGVCCEQEACADCFRCDGDADRGSCTPRAAGAAPAGECLGDSAECGAGQCDGVSGCAYKPTTQPCGQPSCDPKGVGFESVAPFCDGAGSCSAAQRDDCGFNQCISGVCVDGCATHADCVGGTDSLCDRRNAHSHSLGRGVCVDPATVLPLSGGSNLQNAINGAASGAYLKLSAGNYTADSVTISGKQIHIVGDASDADDVVLDPNNDGVPALRVQGAGSLLLQRVRVQGATSAAAGIDCSGGSTLVVLDAAIINNAGLGVSSTSCTVELRRTRLRLNDGGGAALIGGAQTLVNNLIANNGTGGISQVGALSLSPSSLVFVNNTVANNSAIGMSGIDCDAAGLQLVNSIVWFNGSGIQHDGCNFSYSNVSGEAPSATNINDDPLFDAGAFTLGPLSPSLDKGTDAAAGVSSIDLQGKLRGADIDQGAYER